VVILAVHVTIFFLELIRFFPGLLRFFPFPFPPAGHPPPSVRIPTRPNTLAPATSVCLLMLCPRSGANSLVMLNFSLLFGDYPSDRNHATVSPNSKDCGIFCPCDHAATSSLWVRPVWRMFPQTNGRGFPESLLPFFYVQRLSEFDPRPVLTVPNIFFLSGL